jgi:hypothetical protein
MMRAEQDLGLGRVLRRQDHLGNRLGGAAAGSGRRRDRGMLSPVHGLGSGRAARRRPLLGRRGGVGTLTRAKAHGYRITTPARALDCCWSRPAPRNGPSPPAQEPRCCSPQPDAQAVGRSARPPGSRASAALLPSGPVAAARSAWVPKTSGTVGCPAAGEGSGTR